MSESKTTTIGSDKSVKTNAKAEMSLPEQNNYGSVAVRLTNTANLYLLLYLLAQHITLKSIESKTVIYQR